MAEREAELIEGDYLAEGMNLYDQPPFNGWLGRIQKDYGLNFAEIRKIVGSISWDIAIRIKEEDGWATLTELELQTLIQRQGYVGVHPHHKDVVDKVIAGLVTCAKGTDWLQYLYQNIWGRGIYQSNGVYKANGERSRKSPGQKALTYEAWREIRETTK